MGMAGDPLRCHDSRMSSADIAESLHRFSLSRGPVDLEDLLVHLVQGGEEYRASILKMSVESRRSNPRSLRDARDGRALDPVLSDGLECDLHYLLLASLGGHSLCAGGQMSPFVPTNAALDPRASHREGGGRVLPIPI